MLWLAWYLAVFVWHDGRFILRDENLFCILCRYFDKRQRHFNVLLVPIPVFRLFADTQQNRMFLPHPALVTARRQAFGFFWSSRSHFIDLPTAATWRPIIVLLITNDLRPFQFPCRCLISGLRRCLTSLCCQSLPMTVAVLTAPEMSSPSTLFRKSCA